MQMTTFYDEIEAIEKILDEKGLEGGDTTCYARFNYYGDEIIITVSASEPWHADDGYWHTEKDFGGKVEDVLFLLKDATEFAYSIPNEEDRVIELMVRRLNQMADSLPKGQSDIAVNAWKNVFNMMKDRAVSISNNALPRW